MYRWQRRSIHVLGGLTKVPKGELPAVGTCAEIHHTFTSNDVENFAQLTGDTNPLHLDPIFCTKTQFKKPIVHGILCTSLFPTIFGATLPGSIYVSQSIRFKKPIYVNEPLQIRIEVTQVKERMRLVICNTECFNAQGEVAITGQANVLLPK
ncbi:MaoClike domain containing protein [Thraustotheca clavata]|uniref:MaoClike domain containing protein n=1 Tax=Thraustotheca clavata TaxID=74557 RepID=A0A1V9YW60_9STRA|nr:MaoClike domain containing protein [Thraustotheca clavata]